MLSYYILVRIPEVRVYSKKKFSPFQFELLKVKKQFIPKLNTFKPPGNFDVLF